MNGSTTGVTRACWGQTAPNNAVAALSGPAGSNLHVASEDLAIRYYGLVPDAHCLGCPDATRVSGLVWQPRTSHGIQNAVLITSRFARTS